MKIYKVILSTKTCIVNIIFTMLVFIIKQTSEECIYIKKNKTNKVESSLLIYFSIPKKNTSLEIVDLIIDCLYLS